MIESNLMYSHTVNEDYNTVNKNVRLSLECHLYDHKIINCVCNVFDPIFSTVKEIIYQES